LAKHKLFNKLQFCQISLKFYQVGLHLSEKDWFVLECPNLIFYQCRPRGLGRFVPMQNQIRSFKSLKLITKQKKKIIFSRRNIKKTIGDTRVWTKDLSICSRMLYHWAISPYIITYALQTILMNKKNKAFNKQNELSR
jgi:hypothetical protein